MISDELKKELLTIFSRNGVELNKSIIMVTEIVKLLEVNQSEVIFIPKKIMEKVKDYYRVEGRIHILQSLQTLFGHDYRESIKQNQDLLKEIREGLDSNFLLWEKNEGNE